MGKGSKMKSEGGLVDNKIFSGISKFETTMNSNEEMKIDKDDKSKSLNEPAKPKLHLNIEKNDNKKVTEEAKE